MSLVKDTPAFYGPGSSWNEVHFLMSQFSPPSSVPLVYSLREQIADRIRNDVICGRMGAGERLNEVHLGEKLGVSRTRV